MPAGSRPGRNQSPRQAVPSRFLQAAFQIVVGGTLVFLAGIFIGSS